MERPLDPPPAPGPWAAPVPPSDATPAPAPSTGQPPAAPAYGPPAPAYGPPASGYGQPAPAYGAPAPGYGTPQPGYGPPAPPQPQRPVWPWVLGGVGCLVLLLVGAVVAGFTLLGLGSMGSEEGHTYGDNAELDALWDRCEAGDGKACDDLFLTSESGSEYEEFGDTCGRRTSGDTFCEGEDLD